MSSVICQLSLWVASETSDHRKMCSVGMEQVEFQARKLSQSLCPLLPLVYCSSVKSRSFGLALPSS